MADDVLITAGDVLDVQLTSETVVIESPAGRRRVQDEPGHITNRMRLFVKELGGKEHKFDFEDCELGVRETQRVAIVRGKPKGSAGYAHLILYNLSSGEAEPFERGLYAYLHRPPFFGPPAKASVAALIVALGYYAYAVFVQQSPDGAGVLALVVGLIVLTVMWWVLAMWDRLTERSRYQKARKRFIDEMTAKVRQFTPNGARDTAGDVAAGGRS